MKLVIYTNILTPYRKYFYDLLYQYSVENGDEFYVFVMAETEGNRSWKYEEFKESYTILLPGKTVSHGEIYIHVNKGLKEKLDKIHPDIVVCAGSYLCPGVWEITKWKKKYKYQCLYWSESHLNEHRDYNKLKVAIRDIVRNSFYKKYDGFWYAGALSRQFIEKYAKKNAKYFFVPNLIEEKKYRQASEVSQKEKELLREKYQVQSGKTVFICPARLSPAKGILEFLDLYNECSNKSKGTILIAGEGKLKVQIKEKAEKMGIDVRLLGYQNQESMVQLYAMADVFLLPSLSDPNPLTCIEALWAGLPLLISNHCGNYPEVVEQGRNGYVFNYDKKLETIKIMEKINNDSYWKENAGKRSKIYAEKIFNSSQRVKEIIDKLKRCT